MHCRDAGSSGFRLLHRIVRRSVQYEASERLLAISLRVQRSPMQQVKKFIVRSPWPGAFVSVEELSPAKILRPCHRRFGLFNGATKFPGEIVPEASSAFFLMLDAAFSVKPFKRMASSAIASSAV